MSFRDVKDQEMGVPLPVKFLSDVQDDADLVSLPQGRKKFALYLVDI